MEQMKIQGSIFDFGAKLIPEPSTQSNSGSGGEYEQFVEKFKPKKTTDDCYTPDVVYSIVLDYVVNKWDIKERPIVRPFWPGFDFTKYDYPADCVVVDNPPFSILTKIIRYYCVNNIDFFLFAPSLTLFLARDCDLTYIISNSEITYHNGAVVRTGFITNLSSPYRVILDPELGKAIANALPNDKKAIKRKEYPDNIITSSILGRIVKNGVSLSIKKEECVPLVGHNELFGEGFLLSTRAAAEKAAAEKAAAAEYIYLTQRDLKMIADLDARI